MIYRQKNRSKFKGIKIVGIIFIILFILRIGNIGFAVQLFDRPVNYILETHIGILNPIKNTFWYFKDKKELQEEVTELKAENINLKLENLLTQTITQEFEYFKNNFGTSSEQSTFFKVILKPPFTPFDTIRISGDLTKYGVDDLVFYKNILIGKIIKKNNKYATVELFSSPNKLTPITIKGAQFEAKGLGGGRFVSEVSKDFEIIQGDPIIYPEQTILVLGVVEFIESKEEDLFKKVYFNLPVSLNEISYVTIGIKQDEQQNTYSN